MSSMHKKKILVEVCFTSGAKSRGNIYVKQFTDDLLGEVMQQNSRFIKVSYDLSGTFWYNVDSIHSIKELGYYKDNQLIPINPNTMEK